MTDHDKQPAQSIDGTFAARLRDAVMRENDKVCLMRLEAPDRRFKDLMVMDVIGATLVSTPLPFFYDDMHGSPDNIGPMMKYVVEKGDLPFDWKTGNFEVFFVDLEPGFMVRMMFVDLAELNEAAVQRVARIRAAEGDICAIIGV